jgi:subtilisin family serine protease
MRRRGAALVGVLALAGLAASRPVGGPVAGAEVYRALRDAQTARVVVAFREPRAEARSMLLRATEVADTRRDILSRLAPGDFALRTQLVAIPAFGGDVTQRGLEALLADPEVLRVDLDVPVHATLAESVPLIHADEVHNLGVTGRGVTVALLDTGLDESHPDLKDAIVAEQCFCANADGSGCCPNGATTQSGPGAARDDQGHGTNVAGIITSDGRVAPTGVAPDAGLVAVKVLDKNGAASSTTQIMQGLDWVMTQHPEIKVVNLSLATANLFSGTCDVATSFTMGFASSINTLRSRGTLVFVSSGNDGNSAQIAAPACASNAIAVGATYDANVGTISFGCTDSVTAADQVACFSNSSSAVDVLAPGAAITSTGIGGGTATFVGTSQAAPHAAAVTALLLSAQPSLSPDQIERALKASGTPIRDPRNGLTIPRIDARGALQAATGR